MPRGLETLGIAALIIAVPGAAQQLAVASRGDDALVFHDPGTGRQVARVTVGRSPHEVAIDATGRRAFVPSYEANTVHAVDLVNLVVAEFVLVGYGPLRGIATSGDGEMLWVTTEDSSAVLELDAETGAITRVWPTRGQQSRMIAATADGRKLYVANAGSGTVSVIDRVADTTIIIATGAGAEGIDISPDGTQVWVSNRDANTVSIIDARTDRVLTTVGSGGTFPVRVRFRPDGREVWVANNRSETVAVFDRASHTLVMTIPVGARPLGVAFSGDSRFAYVTRPGENEVVVIDTVARQVQRRFETAESPDGVVWIP